MDMLKLIPELHALSGHVKINFLEHFFKNYNPTLPANLKSLRASASHLNVAPFEASDYRTVYHEFCDWLYGWNVYDGVDLDNNKNIGSKAFTGKISKSPRGIF